MFNNKMDIYSPKGTKVIVTDRSRLNGRIHDQKDVEEFLVVGEPYTVDRTMVYHSKSDVFLKEFPDKAFNTSMFENTELYTEELF